MSTHFRITYDGTALQTHEMEVRQLAPALHALGDLLESANHVVGSSRGKVAVNVKGSFKTGSFGIDIALVQSITDQMIDLLTTRETQATATLLALLGLSAKDAAKSVSNGLIGVVRWLRGRRIVTVTTLDDGLVKIETDDDSIITELQVLALLKDAATMKALQGVIHDPLQNDGIDSFASGTDDAIECGITKEESAWFAYVERDAEPLNSYERECWLLIESPSFKDGNKWKVSDGSVTFHAAIEDADFLQKIEDGIERFGKGDRLHVVLRVDQSQTPSRLMTEYAITSVMEHKAPFKQERLIP
ncbi:MAG: hypothetical protein AB7E72_16095 [Lysobacterales bacterium]